MGSSSGRPDDRTHAPTSSCATPRPASAASIPSSIAAGCHSCRATQSCTACSITHDFWAIEGGGNCGDTIVQASIQPNAHRGRFIDVCLQSLHRTATHCIVVLRKPRALPVRCGRGPDDRPAAAGTPGVGGAVACGRTRDDGAGPASRSAGAARPMRARPERALRVRPLSRQPIPGRVRP